MPRSYSNAAIVAAALLVVSATGSSVADGQEAYKAGTYGYRVEQAIEANQTVQGQTVKSSATSLQQLSLVLSPASQALQFSLTVDSASTEVVGAPPQQQEMAAATARELMGKSVAGTISPQGRVTEVHAADSSDASTQMLSSARGFLPKLPDGGLKAGATWTDSVTSNFSNNGVDGTTTVISMHEVTGDTTIAGQSAWRISRKGSVTMKGAGMSQGTDISLSGTGTVTGDSYVSKDGVYLGSDQLLIQNMTIEVPAAGMVIPMGQMVTTKVSRAGK